jgi:pimeloyl-ACP methyl ester carboxylesterase
MELMVPVDGGALYTEDTQSPGYPVVLLHPGWGDSRIWQPVVDRLAGRARTVRYDTRGYHRSPASAVPFTQLGDLRAVLDHLAVPPAVVVGHSGGGGTAIGLALADPGRVRSLLLLAPGLPDYPWPADDPFFVQFGALLADGDREGLTALGMRTWACAADDPTTREQIGSAATALLRQPAHQLPDPPAFDRLAEIAVPCTLMIGGRDHPAVVQCANTVAARIRDSRTLTFPRADHMLPLRIPEVVADHIARHGSGPS